MKWQPMPACAREPSGTLVLVLCGQPAQKYGMRLTASPALLSSSGGVKSRTCCRWSPSVWSLGKWRAIQCATISISREGRSSPSADTSGAPCASRLPTISGR
jgi:hypothetical protein